MSKTFWMPMLSVIRFLSFCYEFSFIVCIQTLDHVYIFSELKISFKQNSLSWFHIIHKAHAFSGLQGDFDEFSAVDELYSSLPLDNVESLEDLLSTGPLIMVNFFFPSILLNAFSLPVASVHLFSFFFRSSL